MPMQNQKTSILEMSDPFMGVCVLGYCTTRSPGPEWAFLFEDAPLSFCTAKRHQQKRLLRTSLADSSRIVQSSLLIIVAESRECDKELRLHGGNSNFMVFFKKKACPRHCHY